MSNNADQRSRTPVTDPNTHARGVDGVYNGSTRDNNVPQQTDAHGRVQAERSRLKRLAEQDRATANRQREHNNSFSSQSHGKTLQHDAGIGDASAPNQSRLSGDQGPTKVAAKVGTGVSARTESGRVIPSSQAKEHDIVSVLGYELPVRQALVQGWVVRASDGSLVATEKGGGSPSSHQDQEVVAQADRTASAKAPKSAVEAIHALGPGAARLAGMIFSGADVDGKQAFELLGVASEQEAAKIVAKHTEQASYEIGASILQATPNADLDSYRDVVTGSQEYRGLVQDYLMTGDTSKFVQHAAQFSSRQQAAERTLSHVDATKLAGSYRNGGAVEEVVLHGGKLWFRSPLVSRGKPMLLSAAIAAKLVEIA